MRLPFMGRPRQPLVGWFGKLPAVGDFAGRGLPVGLREDVYGWFAAGMARLLEQYGEQWQEAFRLAPVWHFAMNAGVWDERALIGCVAPSVDRVGRCSPLIAMRSLESDGVDAHLPPQSDWSCKVESLLRRVISENLAVDSVQFELETSLALDKHLTSGVDSAAGILAELGIGDEGSPNWFSWPDLPERFGERPRRSFWWAEPSPNKPPRQFIHNGAPDAELFELLMVGWVRE